MRWRFLGALILLTGCFDLDAPRPECFEDEPCANGAACMGGVCGDAPRRTIRFDVSACSESEACRLRWEGATLCGVVEIDGISASGPLSTLDESLDLQVPLGEGEARGAVFVTDGSCEGLTTATACGGDCRFVWLAPPAPAGADAVTLTFDCSTRWPDTAPVEQCDGADDDCDGRADEELAPPEACTAGVGACQQTGEAVCVDGAPSCNAVAGQPVDEVEGDGIDNDCDGVLDEAPPACPPGESRPCGNACGMGMQVCDMNGVAGPCLADGQPIPEPAEETCDGADNDCDGTPDEGFDVGSACPLGGPGCPMGMIACNDGVAECQGDLPVGAVELCNGLDDDCDNQIDEDFDVGGACLVGVGSCARDGTVACEDDAAICTGEPGPPAADELCNGLDDDCDGMSDEGLDVGAACTRGEAGCAEEGVTVCLEDGSVVCDAPDPRPFAEESCDGADNDCDDLVDEGFDVGAACQRGEGACVEDGQIVCDMEGAALCDAADPREPAEEVCNTVDDDCDDLVDEGFDLNSLEHCGACDAVCARDRAVPICDVGTCRIERCEDGFADADGVDENGCECQVLGADEPDPDNIDADCDGVDGDADTAIFVDPVGGDDAADGARATPVATLNGALQRVDANRRHILLAVGEHTTGGELIPSGVHLHGGYVREDDAWQRVSRDEGLTILRGPPTTIGYAGLVETTWLDRLDVVADDGLVGGSSIAIIARSVGDFLVMREVHVIAGVAGAAGNGADGLDGDDTAQPGEPGVGSAAGAAGTNAFCANANGGRGANANEPQGEASVGGAPGGPSGLVPDADGQPGEPGTAGADGASGTPGVAAGSITNGRWVQVAGRAGGPGLSGTGGGGGGSGGIEAVDPGPARLGGAGGGGGAGACGGGQGSGGSSGGASIALFVEGGRVRTIASRFVAQAAGDGGRGGNGGAGATGADGGAGEPLENCANCGQGAPGGRGGDGGCGGPGGGGAGGPSIAILGVGALTPATFEDLAGAPSAPDVTAAEAGAAGAAGEACGVAGEAGPAGIALPIGCCRLEENGVRCASLAACDDLE